MLPERDELAALCAALAMALDHPTEALIHRELDNPLLCALARSAAREAKSPLAQVFDALWEALDAGPPLQQLALEHTRLFLGPRAPRLQPYEHALGGRTPGGGELPAVYAREDFGVSPGFKDHPDHLCIELEFMAQLLQSGRLAQAADFARAHLSPLLAHIAPRLRDETRHPFYRIVADGLAALAQLDFRGLPAPGVIPGCRHEELA